MAKSIIRNVVWVVAFFAVFGAAGEMGLIYTGEGEERQVNWLPFIVTIALAALFATWLDTLLKKRI